MVALKRAYISDEAYIRMKKFAAEENLPLSKAFDLLVLSSIDESGKRLSPLGEVAKEVEELAMTMGVTVPEAVEILLKTAQVIYSSNLPLWKALRPLEQLGREVEPKVTFLRLGRKGKRKGKKATPPRRTWSRDSSQ